MPEMEAVQIVILIVGIVRPMVRVFVTQTSAMLITIWIQLTIVNIVSQIALPVLVLLAVIRVLMELDSMLLEQRHHHPPA